MQQQSMAVRLGRLLIVGLVATTSTLAATGGPAAAAADPPDWSQEVIAPAGIARAHLGSVDLREANDGRLVAVAVRSSADESSAGLSILERPAGASTAWRILAMTRSADVAPSLDLAAGGAVSVAWIREGSGVRVTSNRTGAWVIEALPDSNGAQWPSLALTIGGMPSVAYVVPTSTTAATLRIASRTVGGWVDRTIATGDVASPSLRIDQWGKRHVVFVRRSGTGSGLYYATDRSGTWETTRLTTAADVAAPRLLLDLAGSAHVVYARSDATAPRVLYATNVSNAWQTSTVSGATGGSNPEIALDATGRPVVAFPGGPSFAASPMWVARLVDGVWSREVVSEDTFAGRPGLVVEVAAEHLVALRPFADPMGAGELIQASRVPATTISEPITLTTSAPIPPGASSPVITWGHGFELSVQFGPNGANRTFELQGTRDGITWITITTLTTNAAGRASLTYRPPTNLWYRAVFAGAPDLEPATSPIVRTVVRQIALLRPTNPGVAKPISRNTALLFTTTVRPARPELTPATVSFYFYRKVGAAWTLQSRDDVVADPDGVARSMWRFSTTGEWYVRAQANPTSYNANSVMSPPERYVVR